MKRNIVFFQNDEEQACVVKLGKKKISATLCSGEHVCALKLVELEHCPTENEKVADIQQINDRTVYLEFINTDSVDTFIEWLEHLKLKLIENKNMKAEELIKNNALQNIEVAGKQKVVFEEIAITAVNMARKVELERAFKALEFILDEWVHGGDAECILEEFKEKLEENK